MVSITTILLFIFGVGFFGMGAYLFGKWVFSVDQKIVKARKALGTIASGLKARGMKKIPDLLQDIAFDDWEQMWEKAEDLAALFEAGADAVLKEFDQADDNNLKARLSTPEGRAFIAALLQDATQATDPAITQAVTAAVKTVATAATIAAVAV